MKIFLTRQNIEDIREGMKLGPRRWRDYQSNIGFPEKQLSSKTELWRYVKRLRVLYHGSNVH